MSVNSFTLKAWHNGVHTIRPPWSVHSIVRCLIRVTKNIDEWEQKSYLTWITGFSCLWWQSNSLCIDWLIMIHSFQNLRIKYLWNRIYILSYNFNQPRDWRFVTSHWGFDFVGVPQCKSGSGLPWYWIHISVANPWPVSIWNFSLWLARLNSNFNGD